MFLRPCFLVVDHEFAHSISSRKLLIETAKFNVITAYSLPEAIATLERFPRVHACVINADSRGEGERFLREVGERYPEVKRVLTGTARLTDTVVDFHVETYSPEALLNGLRTLFPRDAVQVETIERKLQQQIDPQS